MHATINDPDTMHSVAAVRAAAADRDAKLGSQDVTLSPDTIEPTSARILGMPLHGPDAWRGLTTRLPDSHGRTMPPEILQGLEPSALDAIRHRLSTPISAQLRTWTPTAGEPTIIGILSPSYRPRSTLAQVDQLLDTLPDPSHLRAYRIDSTPQIFRADFIDPTHAISVPDDPSDYYPGAQVRTSDVGAGAEILLSYLFRLICSNGVVATIAEGSIRRVHAAGRDWHGELLSPAAWEDHLRDALRERYYPDLLLDTTTGPGSGVWELPNQEPIYQLIKPLASRPNLSNLATVVDILRRDYREPLSRWSLSQSASAAANRAPTTAARGELQEWAGRLLTHSTREILPSLSEHLNTN